MSVKGTRVVDVVEHDDECIYQLPIPGRRSKLTVSVDDAGYIVVEDTLRRLSVRYVGDVDGGYAVHIDSHLPFGRPT